MRLICPNCSAQYEIDAALIPDEGRDVQCSNCGHNWFELPPASENLAPPPDMDLDPPEPEPALPEPLDESSEEAGPEADEKDAPADALPDDEADDDMDWPRTRAATLNVPRDNVQPRERPRRPAELAALEILKEEADRELAQRQEKVSAPIETQPDLALKDPRDRETPSRALRARMARLRGEEDEVDEPPAEEEVAYRPPRRDLLPDIDEINSSLRPAGLAKGERSEAEEAEHRRGFRLGFVGMVAISALAILSYAQAPAIANAMPGTERALIGYVDWANRVRDALGNLF